MWWKVILNVLVFRRRFIAEMFSALPAVFLFGWDFVCLLLVWLFILSPFIPFYGSSLKISKPHRQRQRVQWLCRVRYNSLFISVCHSLQNNNMELSHSAYSRGREIRRPILKISFSNFHAVVHILFKISLTAIDKLDECKFLRHSWVEYKVVFNWRCTWRFCRCCLTCSLMLFG